MKSRLEWRVGLFVLVALVLVAVLLLAFSKGTNVLRPTYDILLSATDVSGLKQHAGVLMSGVKVGSVDDIELGPKGKSVIITLRIYKKYEIHADARFLIQQAGFLGDEYVSIAPTANAGPIFTNDQPAAAEVPFNFEEAARSATGLLQRVNETVNKLNAAITRIDSLVLNERSLTNISVMIANFRQVSESTKGSLDRVEGLIGSNAPAIGLAISNLVDFSDQLKLAGGELKGIVGTNGPVIATAVKNVETSTETLKGLLQDVQNGQGTVGGLIKNQQLATNVAEIAANLSVTTSNLNRFGLWHALFHHNPPPRSDPKDGMAQQKTD